MLIRASWAFGPDRAHCTTDAGKLATPIVIPAASPHQANDVAAERTSEAGHAGDADRRGAIPYVASCEVSLRARCHPAAR
jgi:hypothetical protein